MTITIKPCFFDIQLTSTQSYIHPRTFKSVFSWVQDRRQELYGPLVSQFIMGMSGDGSWVLYLVCISCFSPLSSSCKLLKLSRNPAADRYTAGKITLKYCFPWSAYFATMQTAFLTREKQSQFLNSKELIKNKINWKLLWASQHNRRAMLRLGESYLAH